MDVFTHDTMTKLLYLGGTGALMAFVAYACIVSHLWKRGLRQVDATIRAEGSPVGFHYITPEEAKTIGDTRPLVELQHLASLKGKCEMCGAPAWRYAGTGLCFTCTTGQVDASNDYEFKE